MKLATTNSKTPTPNHCKNNGFGINNNHTNQKFPLRISAGIWSGLVRSGSISAGIWSGPVWFNLRRNLSWSGLVQSPPSRPNQSRPGHTTRSGLTWSDLTRPGLAWPEQVWPEQVWPDQSRLDQTRASQTGGDVQSLDDANKSFQQDCDQRWLGAAYVATVIARPDDNNPMPTMPFTWRDQNQISKRQTIFSAETRPKTCYQQKRKTPASNPSANRRRQTKWKHQSPISNHCNYYIVGSILIKVYN